MTEADVDAGSAPGGHRDDDSREVDSGETNPRGIDPDVPEIDPERVELLFVLIDGERYAIERGRLQHVVEPSPITRVPRTPEIVRGVTQVSGAVAAVVDARRLFDRPPGEIETGRFVLLERDPHETALALRVDAVETFETVHVTRISLGTDEELIRAVIDAEAGDVTEDSGQPSAKATTGGDANATTGGDANATTGGDATIGDEQPIPIVDVDALFEAATV